MRNSTRTFLAVFVALSCVTITITVIVFFAARALANGSLPSKKGSGAHTTPDSSASANIPPGYTEYLYVLWYVGAAVLLVCGLAWRLFWMSEPEDEDKKYNLPFAALYHYLTHGTWRNAVSGDEPHSPGKNAAVSKKMRNIVDGIYRRLDLGIAGREDDAERLKEMQKAMCDQLKKYNEGSSQAAQKALERLEAESRQIINAGHAMKGIRDGITNPFRKRLGLVDFEALLDALEFGEAEGEEDEDGEEKEEKQSHKS